MPCTAVRPGTDADPPSVATACGCAIRCAAARTTAIAVAVLVLIDHSRFLSHRASEVEDGQREHLRRVDEIVNCTPLVRLMRQIQNSRSVRDAVANATEPIHVLVIVCAGTGHSHGRTTKHGADLSLERRD